jgi:hypothetical protein
MGLVRRGQSARRRRCRCTSLTTSNAEIARNIHAPFGFRRHGSICSVSVLALLDDVHRHRLRRAAWHLSVPVRSTVSATVLGTRYLLILGQTPGPSRDFPLRSTRF